MSNLREYINDKTLIKDEIFKNFEFSVSCSICTEILINPMMCMKCQAVFCKSCIDTWSKKSADCPNRCENTNYKQSILSQNILSKLKFICPKCEKVINYDDIKDHSLIKCYNEAKITLLLESQENNKTTDTVNSKHKNILIYFNIFFYKYSNYSR